MVQKTAYVNNAFYDELGALWTRGSEHPVALLRAENRVRNPWILETIENNLGKNCTCLDIGCGGGLLTNYLAFQGIQSVEGIDLSMGSLIQAKKNDTTQSVIYRQANAVCLPHKNNSFDVVTAMDILEHVEQPEDLIREAARVLRPGGLFFFHTFNRNFFSWLTTIKGLPWFVKNTPKNLHLYRLFLQPTELSLLLAIHNIEVVEMRGLQPIVFQTAFWKMLMTRRVDPHFRFSFSRSLRTGYCGYARKKYIVD